MFGRVKQVLCFPCCVLTMDDLILDPSVDDLVYIGEDDEAADLWWSSQWELPLAETY